MNLLGTINYFYEPQNTSHELTTHEFLKPTRISELPLEKKLAYLIHSFTTMLIGEFETRLTDKNRLAVPKKFRTEFVGNLVISRGYEGCLILLDESRWQALIERITRSSILNVSVRDTLRFLLGGAFELELDSQGRFVMPTPLREYAKVDIDVIFIGISNWVEVWDKQIWQDKLTKLQSNASDIAEELLKVKSE